MNHLFERKSYRAKDIAETFGIGESTVWYYVSEGKLKSIKVSARVTIFKADDVHEFFGVDSKTADLKRKKVRRVKKSKKEIREVITRRRGILKKRKQKTTQEKDIVEAFNELAGGLN